MKRLITFSLWLALAASASAQYPNVAGAGSGHGNTTCAVSGNVTSGNTVFVQIFSANGSAPGVASVTSDTRSSSWTTVYTKDYSAFALPNDETTLFSAPMGSSGAESIVMAVTNSPAFVNSICWEEKLQGLTFSLDGTPSVNEAASVSSLGTGNTTTTVNGDLLISGVWSTNAANQPNNGSAAGATFLGYSATSLYLTEAYRRAGAAGNYAETFSPGGAFIFTCIAALKLSSTTVPIVTAPATLPKGLKNSWYSYGLTGVGGAGAYTWTVSSGSLPVGLVLNSSTGVINGVPAGAGSTFTVTLTDAGAHTGTLAITLPVGTAASTITHVQDSNGSGVFGSNVTTGNLVVVPHISTVVPVCTDSLGTVYTLSMSELIHDNTVGNAPVGEHFFVGVATSTGADTVTCTPGTNLAASEFSGAQNFGDSQIYNFYSGSSSPQTTASLNTPANAALLFAGITVANPGTSTSINSPATETFKSGQIYEGGYQVAGIANAYSEAFALTGAPYNSTGSYFGLMLESFRPAVAGTAAADPPALPQLIQSWQGLSTTCVFQHNVTSGSTIFAFQTWTGSTNTPAVSDSLITSFSQAFIDTSQTVKGAIYVGVAGAGGADTVTFTVSGSSNNRMGCAEWSLNSISRTVDASNTTAFVSANPKTTTNLTTNLNGDLLFIFGYNTGEFNFGDETLGDNYISVCTACGFGSAFRVTGVNTTYNSAWGYPSAGNLSGSIFQVAFAPVAIAIVSPAIIPDAVKSGTYSYTMQAVGGAGAYTWSISAGALPPGLSINSSTGAITGTATSSALGAFTIQVTDGTHTTTQSTTLHVGTGASTATWVKNSDTAGGFTGSVTSGNLIHVSILAAASLQMGIPKCTDSLGTPFKLSMTSFNIAGAKEYASEVGIAPSTGADTVACPGSGIDAVLASEYSGVQNFDDAQINTASTSTTTLTTSSLTPKASNALLLSSWNTVNNTSSSSYGTCTSTFDHLDSSFYGCFQIATTVTGYTETLTTAGASGLWGSTFQSFRPASTGTAPTGGVPRHRGGVY